jgi:DNA-binding MarR family transcriptional regulator
MKSIDEILQANFTNERHKAIVNVRHTSHFIGSYHETKLKKFDLSLAQFNILRILKGARTKLSIKVIRDRMLEKSPNTTRLIDKLINKGFVERARCKEDRRVVYVIITDQGLEMLEKVNIVIDDISLLINLSEEEAKQLNYLLDKMRDE